MGMEMPSFEQVPEKKKEEVVTPRPEKSGLSHFADKVKTGIALAVAIGGVGMSEMNEAHAADRLQATRTTENLKHPSTPSGEKTVQTPLGKVTYTNPLDALLTPVRYQPKVIRHTTSFGASVGGVNNKVGVHLEARHSDHVVNPGSQSRKVRNK